MCNVIKCSIVVTLIVQSICSTEIKNGQLLYSEQEIVDTLVKTWSPLVWLAPNEKFLPGDVRTFLTNVHAEREKKGNKKIKDIGDNLSKYSHYYQNDVFEDLIYYEGTDAPSAAASAIQNNRKRRNFDKDTSLEYIFELPIDDASENWYLVTNDELDNLMKNKSSFIFGEKPSAVPIYAVVNMCGTDSEPTQKHVNEIEASNKFHYKKNPYIPLTKTPEIYDYSLVSSNKVSDDLKLEENEKVETNEVDDRQDDDVKANRRKRSEDSLTNQTQPANLTEQSNERWKAISSPNVIIYTKDDKIVLPSVPQSIKVDEIKIVHDKPAGSSSNIPHFHVTYWMFYPFSQGKTVCTLNLGPLGPIPIPLLPIFNICLGTKKEFGSHVGDWEHMSLFFRGRMEPDEMYVSAHDAGAIYSFDRLTGTFEFKSQETRKGIFQKPTFPKTVITSDNHPVLFSAEGSHGLWASPGKHRFVRVPRLYDINGFGQPWETWKNVEVIYNEARGKRSMGGSNPNWMKYRGKWGNPKTKCHPLRRIGLHVCEQTDGPTGIPKKTAHFTCTR